MAATSFTARQDSRAAVVWLGVIALHLAGWHALRSPPLPDRVTTPSLPSRLTTLRLLPMRAPPRANTALPAPARPSVPSPTPRRAPAAITLRAAPSASPVADAAAAMPTAATNEPPIATGVVPAPLDLRLMPGFGPAAPRHPGRDDPRANTPRTTAESRMAAALDDGRTIVEERLADGRLRLRRGADCVIAAPSRSSQLFPFDDAAQRTPRLISACP